MIAKRIPMKSVSKSSFAGLVNYISDTQSKNERIGYLTVSNCHSDNTNIAVIEVLNTQAQNTRAESDKNYHLILSFPSGERPDDKTLVLIEARICGGLGYGEHQRVSVVHHDTDNLHIHIAINKIHPTRYTMHDPYNDFKTLGQLCKTLEEDYGLKQDNHQANKRGAENLADDMERHSGEQSLIGWVKRECIEEIRAASSWGELHKAMGANGLDLHERGNGLVINARDGTTIKASSIGRDFSKSKLESRFGPFEKTAQQPAKTPIKKQYVKGAMPSRVNTVELYARYRDELQRSTTTRAGSIKKAIARKTKLIETAKRSAKLKRAAVKPIKGAGIGKKAMYGLISKSLKAEIERVNKEYLAQRQDIYNQFQRRTWADWLREKAYQNDVEALNALRAREAARGLTGNTVAGTAGMRVGATVNKDSVTKKGTIIYRFGSTAVRDDGGKLSVTRGSNIEGLETTLKMAADRFGECLKISGTSHFKEQVAIAAARGNLHITFDDPALEQRRQGILKLNLNKEKQNERTEQDRGRFDRRGIKGDGLAFADHDGDTRREQGRPASRPGSAGKPNVAKLGTRPPPQGQNRLRRMSELGVVHITSGSPVLLQGNVPHHLEQQGSKTDNRLRRGVLGAGELDRSADAAKKYISEREEKRRAGFDIPKHAKFEYTNDADISFAGIRKVEAQNLALLHKDKEIMVLAVDEASALKLKRLSIGDRVSVNRSGKITRKGRSR